MIIPIHFLGQCLWAPRDSCRRCWGHSADQGVALPGPGQLESPTDNPQFYSAWSGRGEAFQVFLLSLNTRPKSSSVHPSRVVVVLLIPDLLTAQTWRWSMILVLCVENHFILKIFKSLRGSGCVCLAFWRDSRKHLPDLRALFRRTAPMIPVGANLCFEVKY